MPTNQLSRRALLGAALSAVSAAVVAGCKSDDQAHATYPYGTGATGKLTKTTAIPPDHFRLGASKPSAANTGHVASLITGTLTGDLVIDKPGTVIENKRIVGHVLIRAANVVLRNCEIVGGSGPTPNPGLSALVDCSADSCVNAVLERCTIRPTQPTYLLNGVRGKSFTALRCDISHVVDAFHIKQGSFAVDGCYLHDFAFFDGSTGTEHAADKRFPGWTHNDGLEIFACTAGQIRGCNIQSYFAATVGTPLTAIHGTAAGSNAGRTYPRRNYASGITLVPRYGPVSGLVIESNWFDGGEVAIQMPRQNKGFDDHNAVTVRDNRFGLDVKPGYVGNPAGPLEYLRAGITGAITASGNIFDNVASVPIALRKKAIPAAVPQAGGGLGWPVS